MNAAQLMVQCLETEGVTRIYGVPGEENADFMMALEGSGIEFVLTRHEQGAAFMAATEGRLTGKAGVCLGTLGPGATNLITGVADGNMDNAPMLVITGQGATTRLHKESHQIMNVMDMYKPVTKWSQAITNPEAIPEIMRKAVKLAEAEKPGAVHIELAEDVASMQVEGTPLEPTKPRRPVPGDKVIDELFDAVMNARRPLIIAGNGAIRKRASKQLRKLCDATGIGVLMTFMAKGAVNLDADYCLFTIGLGQKDFPVLAVEDSDLIITLGYDMVEYPPKLWNPDGTKKIVHIDFEPAEVDQHYMPELEIVGDVAHALWMLNERLKGADNPKYDFSTQRDLREKMQQEFLATNDDTKSGKIKPQKILSDLRRVLAPDDIVLSGVGAHKMWIARNFQAHNPATVIISNGFCSMGMALPGAIAAARVKPESKVVAVVGDGDLMMNVQEMETASRLGSNINVLVWEDKSYGLIAWKQEQEFGSHTPLSFNNPKWAKLAEAFGWSFDFCDDPAQLKSTLEKAMRESGPSLIVVPVDYAENMKLTKRLGDILMR